MDDYDIKVIREEGDDTRKALDLLRVDVKQTNEILQKILIELIKINVNTADKSPWTIE